MSRFFLFSLLFALCIQHAYAQSATLSGTVSDMESGETLIGASVLVGGQSMGTTTNEYGYYSLSLPTQDSLRIEISYVGFQTQFQTVFLTADKQLNIELSKIENDYFNTLLRFMVRYTDQAEKICVNANKEQPDEKELAKLDTICQAFELDYEGLVTKNKTEHVAIFLVRFCELVEMVAEISKTNYELLLKKLKLIMQLLIQCQFVENGKNVFERQLKIIAEHKNSSSYKTKVDLCQLFDVFDPGNTIRSKGRYDGDSLEYYLESVGMVDNSIAGIIKYERSATEKKSAPTVLPERKSATTSVLELNIFKSTEFYRLSPGAKLVVLFKHCRLELGCALKLENGSKKKQRLVKIIGDIEHALLIFNMLDKPNRE